MPDEAKFGAHSLRNRIRYRFDNLLARGMWAVLLWLGLLTLLAVLISSGLLAAFGVTFAGSEDSSWLEDFWQSLLRIIDPGTMVADVGWGRRLLALLVTVVGILVAGTLIGLIASGVEQRVEAMRRGRSVVVESGHVVVLGGSRRLPDVVDQLVLADFVSSVPSSRWSAGSRPRGPTAGPPPWPETSRCSPIMYFGHSGRCR